MPPFFCALSLFLGSLSMVSCVLPTYLTQAPVEPDRYLEGYGQTARPRSQGYWDGDGIVGTPKIVIHRAEQKAFFYKGEQLVSVSPVSTGKTGHTTPAGTFKVTQKNVDHRSSLYGVHRDIATGQILNNDVDTRKDKVPAGAVYEGAPMFNFLRFNGAIGMHTGYLPGYPASHGCVRLPDHIAKKFFENSPLGTKVIVQ